MTWQGSVGASGNPVKRGGSIQVSRASSNLASDQTDTQERPMRAIVCERLGGPEHLVVREVPSPTPGPGEVKVALRARGVSFVDVLVIAGQYQSKREVPFIPGGEAAGVVVEVGLGVQGVAAGARVLVPEIGRASCRERVESCGR